ncbi:MAG TPA: two-component system response regulator [Coprothermobacter sp.]|nr:two-component system response regulator [Coprothermobacter sp.]
MDRKFVLLVEDSPDDVELTLRALSKSDTTAEVIVAHDGVEALGFLYGTGAYAGRNTSVMPAIVFLDLKLPRINGFEVLERIRSDERIKLLPVVILTSSNEEKDLIRSYELGANSYVCKPVDFTEFSNAICQLGLYWLFLNESPMKENE